MKIREEREVIPRVQPSFSGPNGNQLSCMQPKFAKMLKFQQLDTKLKAQAKC